MAGFVAGAIIGSTIIGGESSKKAASTQAKAAEKAAKEQAEGAVRVAEIEAETAREAAELQAEAYRKASAELESGIRGAAGIESTTPRAPGPVTPEELSLFNQAVSLGRFDDAARIAVSLGVAPETVTDYINANLGGLNLPAPVTRENIAELMSRARLEGGGVVAGAEMEARAAEEAAAEVARGETEATRLQNERIAEALAAQRNLLSPYTTAGETALNRLTAGLAAGGEFAQPFTTERFEADPGYAFRLSEGQKALERQAAARGGLISGAALKAATRFGQDMGSQEFQRAFERYYAERQAQLDPLFQLYSGGLGAAGELSGAERAAGTTMANYLGAGETGAARARAQGVLSAGAARSSGYLEDIESRARAARELASARASGYTGPAAFTAEGLLGAGTARAGGVRGSTAATSEGLLRAGEARAAGTMGVANALTSGLGTGINYYQNQQLLNRLAPSPTSSINITSNPTMGNFPTLRIG